MSTPSNILSSFRSYSYYHILAVCDSTQTAEILSRSNEIVQFQHPRNNDRFSPRMLSSGGKYVVLINGISDSTFIINSAKWETVIAPSSTTADGMSLSTMMQLDGEIEIFEPLGSRFLDLLSHVSDSLNSDPMGLVFVLKTVFVGFKDDGVSQESITTVRPFLFTPIDISAVFDQTGAKYLMAVVGVTNGSAKLAPVTNIGGGLGIHIRKGQTLKEVFNTLEKTINSSYYSFLNATKKKFIDAGIDIDLEKSFRLVKYKIQLDIEFNEFKAGTNQKSQVCDKVDDPIIHFNSSMGIEEILHQLMMSSAEVIAGKPDVIFKISSTINSTPLEYVVTYHIHRYELKTMTVDEAANTVNPDPGQYIEFDYIFTGKNIDIIDFDIRMEMGMAFFQTLTTAESIPNQYKTLNGMSQDISNGSGGGRVKISSTNKPRSNTPLFLGSSIADRLIRNVKNPVDTLGFQAMLNRHAAMENVQAKVVIHGNPQLMNEMMILPDEVSSGKIETPKANQTANPTWLSAPTLIKININTPIDPDNLERGFKPFWYQGFYSLYSIGNIFEDGEFKQTLDMFSLPVVDETAKLTEKDKTDTETTQQANQVLLDRVAQSATSPEEALNILLRHTAPRALSPSISGVVTESNVADVVAARNAFKQREK